jgi:hypothetical protein
MGIGREPSKNARGVRRLDTDDFTRMSARTLAYKFMALTPVIFLAGLAVHARTYTDQYQPQEQTPLEQAAITAFVPVLKETKPVLSRRGGKGSDEDLRNVADLWISSAEQGRLGPLYPVSLDDSPSEGVKGQIFSTKSLLVGRLLALSRREAQAGKADMAATDALRAVWVAQVLKFSCYDSVHACATEQRRALELILDASPSLSENTYAMLAGELHELKTKQRPMNMIASLARRHLIESVSRVGDEPLAIEAGRQFVAMRRVLETNPDKISFRDAARRTLLAGTETPAPNLVTDARLGYLSQSDFSSTLETVLQALKKPVRV